MKVQFIVRSDHVAKFGGDRLQVERYADELAVLGVRVTVVPYAPSLPLDADAVTHIVNIDRPYDFLSAVRQSPGPFVVSPIHHELGRVRAMRHAEPLGGVRTVAGWLPESARELLAYGVRSYRGGSRTGLAREALCAASAMPRVWARVGRALDRASAVAVLAQGEAEVLMRDTGWAGRNIVLVPNGRPALPVNKSPHSWSERDRRILVVGRIEPRKRQLEIAQVAAKVGASVVFLGPLSPSSPGYASDFLSVVNSAPSLEWAGEEPHEQVLSRMAGHRVLLNLSWVEVQSLVDLEAASSGCFVVASGTGHSAEWMPDHVRVFEPSEVALALAEATRLSGLVTGPPRLDYGQTWERASRQLLDVYRELSAPSGSSSASEGN
jgi:glycosyltransferase involved in cell wall biosynthesis